MRFTDDVVTDFIGLCAAAYRYDGSRFSGRPYPGIRIATVTTEGHTLDTYNKSFSQQIYVYPVAIYVATGFP